MRAEAPDYAKIAVPVPLTPVNGDVPRSPTGSHPPSSGRVTQLIPAICTQGVRQTAAGQSIIETHELLPRRFRSSVAGAPCGPSRLALGMAYRTCHARCLVSHNRLTD